MTLSSTRSLPNVFNASITKIVDSDINDISLFALCLNETVILSHENFLYGPSLIYDQTTGTCVDNPSLFKAISPHGAIVQ